MADDRAGVEASRPTLTVGGQHRPALEQGLLEMLVAEDVTGLFRCEARFGNWGEINGATGFLYFDRAVLDFGKPFVVKIGDAQVFDGRIMGLEAEFPDGRAAELTVLAEDRLQDLRMTRRTRTFADLDDAGVIRQIAGDHGLTANVSLQGPTHKVLAQVNQSDLAFVRERARSLGAELWMEGSALHVKPRASRTGSPLRMTHGKELREFSVLSDLARQRTAVSVTGWDVAGKQPVKYDATDQVVQGELEQGTSGAKLLKEKIGERKDTFAHMVPMTSREAQDRAEAAFRAQARRFLTARGVAEPNGRLRVGAHVDLQGLGPMFSGKYYVAEVTHVFDGKKGIRTEFKAERAGLGK